MGRIKLLEYRGKDLLIDKKDYTENLLIKIYNDFRDLTLTYESIERYNQKVGQVTISRFISKSDVEKIIATLNNSALKVIIDTLVIDFDKNIGNLDYMTSIIERIYDIGYNIILIDPNKGLEMSTINPENILELNLKDIITPTISPKEELVDYSDKTIKIELGYLGNRTMNKLSVDLKAGTNLLLNKDKLGFELDEVMTVKGLLELEQEERMHRYKLSNIKYSEFTMEDPVKNILVNYLNRIDRYIDKGKHSKPYILLLQDIDYMLLEPGIIALLEQCLVLGERCNMGIIIIADHSKEFPNRLGVLM